MVMRRWMWVALVLLAGLMGAGVVFFDGAGWDTRYPAPLIDPAAHVWTPTSPASAAEAIQPADGAMEPASTVAEPSKSEAGSRRHVVSEVIHQLADGDADRWLKTAAKLDRMPPEQQWEALAAPGVSDQPYAKLLRSKMVTACSVILRRAEVRGGVQTESDSPALDTWCHELSQVATTDDLFAQAALGYPETNNPDWWVPPFSAKDLSDDERSAQLSNVATRWRQARSFQELQNTLTALWDLQSDVYGSGWDEVAKLSRYDRGLLQATVPLAAACSLTQSCGPTSIQTMTYCALMPGFECLVGMRLQDVMRWNLSPRVFSVAEKMVAQAGITYGQ